MKDILNQKQKQSNFTDELFYSPSCRGRTRWVLRPPVFISFHVQFAFTYTFLVVWWKATLFHIFTDN